jgi:hypothetical protein
MVLLSKCYVRNVDNMLLFSIGREDMVNLEGNMTFYNTIRKKCKNCGHQRHFHAMMGSITKCDAIITRVPKKFCDCKKFEEMEK